MPTLAPDREVIYKTVGEADLKLHVFEPEGLKPEDRRPAIVFFFGGGWETGTPEQFYQKASAFAARGLVGFSADYRVRSRHQTTPFEAVQDAKSAVRWIRTHAVELGVDPDRIVAAGGSAGGHIAGCTGVIKGGEEDGEDLSVSSAPNLMILYNPVLDTTDKGYGADRFPADKQTALSLTHQVTPDIVPTLLFHGTDDKTVPFENAERFARLMKEAGNECVLVPFEGKGHGFFNGSRFREKNSDEAFDATMKHSLEFLDAHGFSAKAPLSSVSDSKHRPNVIFILADDMGYSDPGFMGSEIQTPNLDRLAAAGTVCTRFMNHAKCEPSRASLMAGVHFHRQTTDHVTREFRQVTTIAAELRKAGYFTASTGKWHLPDQPTDHGFDHFFGLVQGAANHFDPDGRLKLDPAVYLHQEFALDGRPFTVTDDNFYSTDAFTDYALRFLKERPAGSPYFLYLAYTAPHWPLQAPAANIRKYEARYLDGWDRLRDERYHRLVERGMIPKEWKRAAADPDVESWNSLSPAQKADASRCMAVHAAMIDRLDEQIGRVIQYLEENNELENTLILFASDNGVSAETRYNRTPNKPAGSVDSFRTLPLGFCNAVSTPYRKYKGWNANGGICFTYDCLLAWPHPCRQGRIAACQYFGHHAHSA